MVGFYFFSFFPSTVITSFSGVSKDIFRNCTNRMYVIYWHNSSINPSISSDSKLNGPSPGLGYIRLGWLWIIYFRHDRLTGTCFACEKGNPTGHRAPWCLQSFVFPCSPHVNVSPSSLKLQRIQKQTRKCPAAGSLTWSCIHLYAQWLGKKEPHSQLAFSRTLGSPTREQEGVLRLHFVTWSHLEQATQPTLVRREIILIQSPCILNLDWKWFPLSMSFLRFTSLSPATCAHIPVLLVRTLAEKPDLYLW